MTTLAADRPQTIEDRYPSRKSAQPQILERRDPVVWSDWRDGAPLSEAQTQAYEREGFLVLDGLFAPEEIEALQAESRRLAADPAGLKPETLIVEPGADLVRSIFEIHTQNALYARLARNARLVDIARFLLGDEVGVHQSRLNYKPGFRGKEFYWHSDFETWHVEDGMPTMRALSMSVLLTPNTAQNGPLMLIPGSHKRYIACVGETPDNHYKQSLKRQDYGVPDDASLAAMVDEAGIAAPTGPAGTVVVFDCNTMHGSNGNITPLPRSNAFFVYNAMSNRLEVPFGPKTPRPEFIAAREGFASVAPVGGSLTPQS